MEKTIVKKNKNLSKNIFAASIMIYPLLLFIVFYVWINFNSFIMAFEKRSFGAKTVFAGLDNFKTFISQLKGDSRLLRISFGNSLKLYFFTQLMCLPLNILFSYVLYKKFFGHKAVRFIVMLPSILSAFVVTLVFGRFVEGALPALMMKISGKDTFPALLTDARYTFATTTFFSVWIGFSSSLIIYPNAMKEIPDEVMESSQIDGVDNMFQELYYMILPLIYPTLTTFIITGFSGIFSASGALLEFFEYGAEPETYNLGYYYLQKTMRGSVTYDYPVLAAGGIMMTLLIAPLTFLIKFLLERFGPEADV